MSAVLVLFGVTSIVFVLIQLSGDPARLLLPPEATAAQIAQFHRDFGLDKPILIQYIDYVSHAVTGNFGLSIRHEEPAMQLVLERAPATAELTLVALFFALLIAIPTGILAATNRRSVVDAAAVGIAVLGQAMPVFLLGIILILVFSVKLGWLPVGGLVGPQSLILPGITLGAYSAAVMARLLRSSLIEVLEQDYIRTAKAKGFDRVSVIRKHALKNAAIPVVTVFGLQVATLFGGAVITESVFSYPGMGRLALQAISDRDFPVVEAFVVVVSAIVIFANLLVDLAYALLDPRIRAGG
jgi:ABC-type dipeptide/oligopeptide/nickel transport system permease component